MNNRKLTTIMCPQCGKEAQKQTGHVNRARKIGAPVYCTKKCSGLGRRTSPEDKKRLKAEYDIAYREKNLEKRIQQGKEWHKKTYNPEKQRLINQARMPKHVEYLRERFKDPEYKAAKVKYDEERLAKIKYGEFWEAAIHLKNIEKEIDNRVVKAENGIISKSQKRKRAWLRRKKQNLMQLP